LKTAVKSRQKVGKESKRSFDHTIWLELAMTTHNKCCNGRLYLKTITQNNSTQSISQTTHGQKDLSCDITSSNPQESPTIWMKKWMPTSGNFMVDNLFRYLICSKQMIFCSLKVLSDNDIFLAPFHYYVPFTCMCC